MLTEHIHMSVIDDPKTLGRARLSFADQHDIDEFIAEEMYQRLAAVGLVLCPMQGPSPTSRAARVRSLASSR